MPLGYVKNTIKLKIGIVSKMKIDKLDAHDRLGELKKQSDGIGEYCQRIINQRPFGMHPFYIFAHARTADDGANKRMVWQPRLTKPKAQTNSMLFRAYPGSDNVKVLWIIPAEELWGQQKKENLTQSKIVHDSIEAYRNNRESLERKELDDLDDAAIDSIYRQIAREARTILASKQANVAASSDSCPQNTLMIPE